MGARDCLEGLLAIGGAGTSAHISNHSALAAVRRSDLETTSGAVVESTVKVANVLSGKQVTGRGLPLTFVPSGRQPSAPPASSRT